MTTNPAILIRQKIEAAMAAALRRAGFSGIEVTMRTENGWTVDGPRASVEAAAEYLIRLGLMIEDGETVTDDELGLTFAYLRAA